MHKDIRDEFEGDHSYSGIEKDKKYLVGKKKERTFHISSMSLSDSDDQSRYNV